MSFQSELFQGVVRNVVRSYKAKVVEEGIHYGVLDDDDIEQDLWEKLFNLYLKGLNSGSNINAVKFSDPSVDKIEKIKIATTVLKNRMVDVLRGHRRDRKKVREVISESSFNSEDDDGFNLLIDQIAICFSTAEDNSYYKELQGLIWVWVNAQSEITKRLFEEKLNPSNEIQTKWVEFCKGSTRYKAEDDIPFTFLCKTFGVKVDVWHAGVRSLKAYLNQQNWNVA